MDVNAAALPPADVVVANLTAAALVRASAVLASSVRPGGTLIVSGVLAHERDRVLHAFDGFDVVAERREHEWIAVSVTHS
jgi:ribosomal protein L11 methyltransferase